MSKCDCGCGHDIPKGHPNETKHTPKPKLLITTKDQVGAIYSAIAHAFDSWPIVNKEEASIIRAVNSHEALLDIAKMALEVAENGDGFRQGVKGIHFGVVDRIKTVIAQAENES